MAINWKVMNGVIAGCTLGGIAITVLFCRGFQHRQDADQQALENWKKAMRAKGEKFELAELNPPRVPKEGNGAPALLEAVAELRRMTNSCPLLDRSISGLKLTAPGKALVATKLPDLGLVVTERWRRKTPTSWEDLDREMKIASPLLEKIREAVPRPVLAVALKRYQLRQGRYPERLDQLVPDFLSTVPVDPMDGRRLRYRLNADGTFTLYSVGDNGTDDGGDPNLQANERELSIWNGLDIVWPIPVER